jgi:hypothetical protein
VIDATEPRASTLLAKVAITLLHMLSKKGVNFGFVQPADPQQQDAARESEVRRRRRQS